MHAGYSPLHLDASRARIAIVGTQGRELFVKRLIEGATQFFVSLGGKPHNVTTYDLNASPHNLSLLKQVAEIASSKQHDAIICLGAELASDRPDPDQHAIAESIALSDIAINSGVIITHGIICANTLQEIEERIGGKSGHKGEEAVNAAIEVFHLVGQIREGVAKKVAVIGAKWHDVQVTQLINTLLHKCDGPVSVFRGAGSLELPFLAKIAVDTGKYEKIFCVGVVMKGATNHALVLEETIKQKLNELSNNKTTVTNKVYFVNDYHELTFE